MDECRSADHGARPKIGALEVPAGGETLGPVEAGRTFVDRLRHMGFGRLVFGRRRPIEAAEARQAQVHQLDGIGFVGMAIGSAVDGMEPRGDGLASHHSDSPGMGRPSSSSWN